MRISDQTSLQNQPTTREHILLRLRQPGGYRALYNTQARDSPATHIVREYNHQPHTELSLSLSRIPSVALLPALPAIPQQSPLSYKPFPHGYEARDALSQPRVTSHHLSDDSRHSGEWRASAHCSTASTRTHPPTLRHPERYNRPPKTEPTGIDHHSP